MVGKVYATSDFYNRIINIMDGIRTNNKLQSTAWQLIAMETIRLFCGKKLTLHMDVSFIFPL